MNGQPSESLLNNDDDWEALMEVSTTDESEKIRALVGDKALPTTDPNQCLLCRRVLSCKSALQMHYRTHTGQFCYFGKHWRARKTVTVGAAHCVLPC